jgi:hypothetical protein
MRDTKVLMVILCHGNPGTLRQQVLLIIKEWCMLFNIQLQVN